MNQEEALRILGLTDKANPSELKTKYRELMRLTHPDVSSGKAYPYEASEINAAYDFLLERGIKLKRPAEKKKPKQPIKWNAPINPAAYTSREIFHNVKDADGQIIGTAVLDSGKFFWTSDEEFGLFLRSIYECSMDLVKNGDMEIVKEVAYLLSQQFMGREPILENTACEIANQNGEKIYAFDASLEVGKRRWVLKPGQYVYPARIANHRLYVRDDKKRELGYISFADDRLYYGLIPVFERKAAKLRMQVLDNVNKGAGGSRYFPLKLEAILIEESESKLMVDINSAIDELIKNSK